MLMKPSIVSSRIFVSEGINCHVFEGATSYCGEGQGLSKLREPWHSDLSSQLLLLEVKLHVAMSRTVDWFPDLALIFLQG